ncbi:hypothetical protein HELRODRAFT_186034 [Helobdella robusta]|uniref:Very long-chain specific acyl-CoA dehydrogenase, mitochondrial n=1 Tax=Helobdella robusta TaxID=6412 RepID=T1FNK5_HELRO|nr:hypothetical protein HELRODRAFT_186034 [Helobdella robusta]ESN94043.1 hypothetical protein HELRODRAFT_186034 [Helobdella robusta]
MFVPKNIYLSLLKNNNGSSSSSRGSKNVNKLLRVLCASDKNLPKHASTAAKFKPTSSSTSSTTSSSSSSSSSSKESSSSSFKPAQESNSFAMNIFRGVIKHQDVFPYKDVLNEEQRENVLAMIDPVETFFKEHNDPARNDEDGGVNADTMSKLKELGAFGVQASDKYGGLNLNNTQYGRIGTIIGANDLGISVMLGAHQSIGYKGISLFGTEAQKQKYIPSLVTGEKMAAFCLTESGSGSDAGSIQTRAVLSPDGKHYILNGNKIWISNGGMAEVFTVFAKTPVTEPGTGLTKDKMSVFIVERGFGGVTSGPPEKKMGIKASNTTEVHFDDVHVPKENLLGEPGEGFKMAMTILNSGRFIMSALLSGTMKACIEKAVEHASNRAQFGKKLESFGTIQEKIARMTMAHYITESMAYTVAGKMDQGASDYHVEAAISKIFGSESAWFVADEAIQILGGNGYMKEVGLERVLRDIRIFRIFEGTNDILRLLVALTGIQYAGSHLKELQSAFKNPTANLGLLIGEGSKRAMRFVGMSTTESLAKQVHPNLVESANLVTSCIENFGIAVESLLFKYGKNVVDEQFLLNRLADSAITIFAMTVVLSRATMSFQKNFNSAQHEEIIAQTVCVEGYQKVRGYLRYLRNDARNKKNFEQIRQISKDVVGNGGLIYNSPLGF